MEKAIFSKTLVIVLLALLVTGMAAGELRYEVTNLRLLAGDPNDGSIKPTRPSLDGLNNLGDVACDGWPDPGSTRPALYHRDTGAIISLGDLKGDFAGTDPSTSRAYSINDQRVVVGSAYNADGQSVPFLFRDDNDNGAVDPGEMRQLTLDPCAPGGVARSINNHNQVVIVSNGLWRWTDANGNWQVDPGEAVLVAPSGSSYGINDAGMVAWDAEHAHRWADLNDNGAVDDGEVATIPKTVFGGDRIAAYDINNRGQVCGWARAFPFNKNHGYVWTDINGDNAFSADEVTAIVPDDWFANVFAWGINDRGFVVGGVATSAGRYAFVFHPRLGLVSLNDCMEHTHPELGTFWISQAQSINNAGQISAYGRFDGGGGEYAVLLTPVKPFLPGDLDYDGAVDHADLATMASHWLAEGCASAYQCGGADLNDDGKVDMGDFSLMAAHWLAGTL